MKTTSILSQMPVLQKASELYGDADFSNTALIACQHLYRANRAIVEVMQEYGLTKENTHSIGKAYSASTAGKELWREVSNVHDWEYDSHQSHDSQMNSHIAIFLENIAKKTKQSQKVLLLDDGGLLHSFAQKYFPTNQLIGVEQTSSGYNRLMDNPVDFPIANVARSRAKLQYETPYIAQRFQSILFDKFAEHKRQPRNALLLGLGLIGSQIYSQLENHMTITPCDSLDNLISGGLFDLNEFDLVIGASGVTSVPHKYHAQFRNTYFASVSSSDREFDAVYIREGVARGSAHEDYTVGSNILLNGGHPLTFVRDAIDGASPTIMDITHAIQYAGACEVMNSHTSGFNDISERVQKELIEVYTRRM